MAGRVHNVTFYARRVNNNPTRMSVTLDGMGTGKEVGGLTTSWSDHSLLYTDVQGSGPVTYTLRIRDTATQA